jgi:predicted nucleotide-binding protein
MRLRLPLPEALTEAFGEETPMRQRYAAAASLDTAAINMNGTPHHEVIEGLVYGKKRALTLMNQAIRSLQERLADSGVMKQVELTNDPPSNDVFVVHGHDAAFKNQVADTLRRAGLNPVILHEQPNGGKTIIEKFEQHGGLAGFAVVLLTPDDVGGPSADQLQPRARQNVIGEMFWFAAKLGRSRVCALRSGDVEVPSDRRCRLYKRRRPGRLEDRFAKGT